MKTKWLFLLILMIIVVLVYFFNSEYYVLKLAENERDSEIGKYNKVKKPYLNEGVYCYFRPISETTFGKNKFGKLTQKTVDKGYQKILFSFTSNELIIDFPYKWPDDSSSLTSSFTQNFYDKGMTPYKYVREVIKFNNHWIYAGYTPTWYFYITDWQIINPTTGLIIEDVLRDEAETAESEQNPYLYIIMGDDNHYTEINASWSFKTTNSSILVQEQIERYNNILMPAYASNFKYPEDVYNLQQQKPRKSWKDLFNHLIIK